jgi:beta-glucuronidase
MALACALLPAPAAAQTPTVPPAGANYVDGPAGRYQLDGSDWLFRSDPQDQGVNRGFFADTGSAGWSPVTVPNAWNRGRSAASFDGAAVWYRKDFVLPDSNPSLTWLLHFDSVNYRATVWLNGRQIGSHTGSYLPFELQLTGTQPGVNHLVVRVDNRLLPTDFPPSLYNERNMPHGGWWNYGGITRDVYLRRVDRLDFDHVQVRPTLPCPTCAATVSYSVSVHNYSAAAQRVHVAGAYGPVPVDLGTASVPAGASQVFSGSVSVPSPHLWSTTDPFLYTATLGADAGGPPLAGYTLLSGVRSIAVGPDGRLLLNGRHLDFRGVAIHEDALARGSALTNADRDTIFAWVRRLGATEIRAHYPLSPYMYEQADRLGILMWSEIPVYRMGGFFFRLQSVRQAALDLLRQNILTNQNHPSVMVWSIGNELNQTVSRAQERAYVASAAATAKSLDPTRPVGIAVAGVRGSGCGPTYAPLDVIGVNDYYGWYGGSVENERSLSPFLDSVRRCERRKAIVVSEFGAEANRHGPAKQKGTYEFQRRFVNFHLRVFATKPWLSGVTYFALQDFRIRPDWNGGNPKPHPPWHQKGLVLFTGQLKPAFATVASWYRRTPQYPLP